ncbi:sensor histidine kinase [Flavobacterium psychrotrophum]|uniref:sensor histidine kinase n=1 Tax=Flavobacterium psychrotrophum TaxID=2294119 RepID=UPI000E315FC4|nr:histidine kinase dimerization/phosphoacceptor domain -containing protein [Flavobacterium psychrotrophum]
MKPKLSLSANDKAHFTYALLLLSPFLYGAKADLQELKLHFEVSEQEDTSVVAKENRPHHDLIARYVAIGSLIILFILIGLLYKSSHKNRKIALALIDKQDEISCRQELLEKLTAEKEWLLNEVHHKVKNNLQLVVSLLNTQSAYLENEETVKALQSSKHRMYAMSLVHNKLYNAKNLNCIDMAGYIAELVHQLKESFDPHGNITFKQDVSNIILDAEQAIPIGLIINEAVTNAFQHAFTSTKGKLAVALTENSNSCTLSISDNGPGLVTDFDADQNGAVGMNLMRGLADQLDGTFSLKNCDGLTVAIIFTKKYHKTGNAYNNI